MSRIRSARGFTLFEVLIAVTILGILLPILFQLFSGTLRVAKKSKDYTQAIAFAQQKLEELTVMKGAPLELESGEGPNGLFWERIVVPTEPLAEEPLPVEETADVDEDDGEESEEALVTPVAPLYEVTVSVRWNAAPSSPATTLHTLVAFAPPTPTPSDADLDELTDLTAP